jgi:MFS family permease
MSIDGNEHSICLDRTTKNQNFWLRQYKMDEVFEQIGAFGRFQKITLILSGMLSALSAIPIYLTVFTLAEPQLICDQAEFNLTSNSTSMDSCQFYERNRSACRFDQTYYKSTIVTEWDLFCERKYLTNMTQTFYMFGAFFSLFVGFFADYYGRKRCLSIIMVLLSANFTLSQLIITLLPHDSINTKYIIYSVSQFLTGLLANSAYCAPFVYLMEMTSKRYHSLFSVVFTYFFVVGELIVVLVAYFVRDWFLLQWLMTGVTLATAVLVLVFVTESPAWLVSKDRFEEADQVIKTIARANKRPFASSTAVLRDQSVVSLRKQENNEAELELKKPGIIDELLCPARNTAKTLAVCYMMTVSALTYYGIGLGLNKMNLIDPYLLYLLSSIAEIIGYSVCYINQFIGRKKTNIIFFAGTAVSCVLVGMTMMPVFDTIASHTFKLVISVLFVTLSKCFISVVVQNLYVYVAELYPARCRSTAVLLVSGLSRIGGLLSPLVILIGSLYWNQLTFIIYSSGNILAVIAAFFIPESFHK